METKYDVTSGPGDFDMAIALFKKPCKANYIDFNVDDPDGDEPFLIMCTRINTCQREGTSDDLWIIEGSCMLPEYKDAGRPTRSFKAHYDVRLRTGHITVTRE